VFFQFLINLVGEGGFGVTVADILSAPSTPAYALPAPQEGNLRPSVSVEVPAPLYSSKAYALDFFYSSAPVQIPDLSVFQN